MGMCETGRGRGDDGMDGGGDGDGFQNGIVRWKGLRVERGKPMWKVI